MTRKSRMGWYSVKRTGGTTGKRRARSELVLRFFWMQLSCATWIAEVLHKNGFDGSFFVLAAIRVCRSPVFAPFLRGLSSSEVVCCWWGVGRQSRLALLGHSLRDFAAQYRHVGWFIDRSKGYSRFDARHESAVQVRVYGHFTDQQLK